VLDRRACSMLVEARAGKPASEGSFNRTKDEVTLSEVDPRWASAVCGIRALRLPGKLERERGLAAARLAIEQRAAYFLLERGVKHLKGLGTADEIVRRRWEKDARRSFLRNAAHVAETLNPFQSLAPRFFRIGPGVNPVFNAEQFPPDRSSVINSPQTIENPEKVYSSIPIRPGFICVRSRSGKGRRGFFYWASYRFPSSFTGMVS